MSKCIDKAWWRCDGKCSYAYHLAACVPSKIMSNDQAVVDYVLKHSPKLQKQFEKLWKSIEDFSKTDIEKKQREIDAFMSKIDHVAWEMFKHELQRKKKGIEHLKKPLIELISTFIAKVRLRRTSILDLIKTALAIIVAAVTSISLALYGSFFGMGAVAVALGYERYLTKTRLDNAWIDLANLGSQEKIARIQQRSFIEFFKDKFIPFIVFLTDSMKELIASFFSSTTFTVLAMLMVSSFVVFGIIEYMNPKNTFGRLLEKLGTWLSGSKDTWDEDKLVEGKDGGLIGGYFMSVYNSVCV